MKIKSARRGKQEEETGETMTIRYHNNRERCLNHIKPAKRKKRNKKLIFFALVFFVSYFAFESMLCCMVDRVMNQDSRFK